MVCVRCAVVWERSNRVVGVCVCVCVRARVCVCACVRARAFSCFALSLACKLLKMQRQPHQASVRKEREASIKFQFFLLSASWPPWNLIIVMYCPKCSPRPGHKRQPIPLPAKLSEEYWSYFKPFDSDSQENFLNVLYYSRNEWNT